MTNNPQTIIRPSPKISFLNAREIWRYRELLYMLAAREIQLRYKQTAFGVVWAVLQPLIPAIIFAVIFGVFAKLPSNGSPYLLFVFTGTMIWNLFSQSITRAGNSLVGNSALISKVYFPRILVPLSSVGAAKTARFLAQTHIGSGNYLAIKERLFGHLSVSEIAQRIRH
jgi:lipopolysaccharide transport system permease protein